MGIILLTIILVGCDIVAVGAPRGLDIQGGTLRSWPRGFKGVAIVPLEVRHIGSDAFSGCKELTSVVLPESIETIGSFAFSGCERLRDIQIPTSVTNVGRSAFFNCQSLTNLVILAQLGKIPGNMCSHCYGLRHVELPYGPVEIGDMAFRGCRSLRSVVIPGSVKRICRGAFVGCGRMSRVELPKGIELVDELAFYGCFDLSQLVVHSVPAKVGGGAFRDCYKLKGCVFSDTPCKNFLYSMSPDGAITTESICRKESIVGTYESVEDALIAADEMSGAEDPKGVLDGLEQTLRIAADGMVDEMPDRNYPVGKVDALAANLFKLSDHDSLQTIKDFFMRYSSPSVDMGTGLVANLSVQDDLAISLEFHDRKLAKLKLSDGLKDVIRRKVKREKSVIEDCVLKWLR